MNQEEILEYIKDEMDFALDLWQDLDESSKTDSFRNYLRVQITSTIFAQKANPEVLAKALEYFDGLGFTKDRVAA